MSLGPDGHYQLALQPFFERDILAANGDAPRVLLEYAERLSIPLGAYKPMPQALEFHKSQARIRFICGGNRSGKSESLAHEVIWYATGTHPWRHCKLPNDIYYCTTTWDKVGETLWGKLRPDKGGLLAGIPHRLAWHNKAREIPEIVFIPMQDAKGRRRESRIYFKAYEQGRESFQASGLDLIADDEQFSEEIWMEQISRIGGTNPLSIACAFTPIISQPWLEKRIFDPPPDYAVFNMPIDANRESVGGFVTDTLIDATIELWAPEVRETRRNGRWGSFLGAVFKTFSRDLHIVKPDREKRIFFKGLDHLPPTILAYAGIDWGGNNPMAVVFGTRIPWLDDDWYVFDEYYWNFREQGPRRLEQHAEAIKAKLSSWHTKLQRAWADHDPADAFELEHYGVPSQPADKDDKRENREWIQTLLMPRKHLMNDDWPQGRPRLHIASRCEKTIEQMAAYHYDDSANPDKHDPKDEPAKVNDHAVDAVHYLLGSEKAYEPSELPQFVGTSGRYKTTF